MLLFSRNSTWLSLFSQRWTLHTELSSLMPAASFWCATNQMSCVFSLLLNASEGRVKCCETSWKCLTSAPRVEDRSFRPLSSVIGRILVQIIV